MWEACGPHTPAKPSFTVASVRGRSISALNPSTSRCDVHWQKERLLQIPFFEHLSLVQYFEPIPRFQLSHKPTLRSHLSIGIHLSITSVFALTFIITMVYMYSDTIRYMFLNNSFMIGHGHTFERAFEVAIAHQSGFLFILMVFKFYKWILFRRQYNFTLIHSKTIFNMLHQIFLRMKITHHRSHAGLLTFAFETCDENNLDVSFTNTLWYLICSLLVHWWGSFSSK